MRGHDTGAGKARVRGDCSDSIWVAPTASVSGLNGSFLADGMPDFVNQGTPLAIENIENPTLPQVSDFIFDHMDDSGIGATKVPVQRVMHHVSA